MHYICFQSIIKNRLRLCLGVIHDPKAVACILNQYSERILAVRGNCEAEVDGFLLEFPYDAAYNSFMLGARRLFITHKKTLSIRSERYKNYFQSFL